MTLFFCCLNARDKKISWVRAGHDPALLYQPQKNEAILLDERGGLPLGIAKESVYEESTLDFKTGSIMVLIYYGSDF